MRKLRWKFEKIDVSKLDERTLILNVYLTQILIMLLALGLLWIQGRSFLDAWALPDDIVPLLWGFGLAGAVLGAEAIISRWVPEEAADDGGINRLLFRNRPLWHIILISLVVAICEEFLFRWVLQYCLGPYWTSILFALVHVRYLKHWLPTGLVFAVSYSFGWILLETGTLWACVAAHFAIDFVSGAVIRYGKKSHEERSGSHE